MGCLNLSNMFTALAPASALSAAPPPLASFADVLRLKFEDVPKYDIGLLNLLCAEGLPRTEEMNIPKFMATLDAWAKWVKVKTEKAWPVFKAKRDEEFHGSENFFRVYWLCQCLSVDFGVRYNSERNGGHTPDWLDSGDQFIHGCLGPRRTGMCAALPVLVIAVGRRLGYPLKMVQVPEHRLFRWDDGEEKFNVEFCGLHAEMRTDEYYRTWELVPWSEQAKQEQATYGHYFKSLTPQEELREFLINRAMMLGHMDRYQEAFEILSGVGRRMDRFSRWAARVMYLMALNGGAAAQKLHEDFYQKEQEGLLAMQRVLANAAKAEKMAREIRAENEENRHRIRARMRPHPIVPMASRSLFDQVLHKKFEKPF